MSYLSIPTVFNTEFITLKNRFVVFSGPNASFAVSLHVQKQERTYIKLRFLLRKMYMQWLCSNAKNRCLFSLRP